MPTIKVLKKQQSNADFVAQQFGTVEALFVFAQLNGIGITDNVEPGTLLQTQIVDEKVAAFFNGTLLDITSRSADPLIIRRGLGYMRIKEGTRINLNDFIVS